MSEGMTVAELIQEVLATYEEQPDGTWKKRENGHPLEGGYSTFHYIRSVEVQLPENVVLVDTETKRLELTYSLIKGRHPRPGDMMKVTYEIKATGISQ